MSGQNERLREALADLANKWDAPTGFVFTTEMSQQHAKELRILLTAQLQETAPALPEAFGKENHETDNEVESARQDRNAPAEKWQSAMAQAQDKAFDADRTAECIIAICGSFVPGGWAHPGDECIRLVRNEVTLAWMQGRASPARPSGTSAGEEGK